MYSSRPEAAAAIGRIRQRVNGRQLSLSQSPEAACSEKVLLLVTNDTHSKMVPYRENAADKGEAMVGGVARRQTYFKQHLSKHPLILDVGDSFQGSPYYSFFGGEVEMAAMERMQYRATAIGNHDFDSGLDELRQHAVEQSPSMKLLCANMVDDQSGLLAFEPHAMYEVGEAKWRVGVVALMGEEAFSVIDKKLRAGLTLEDPWVAARRSVTQLKADGAELLVCLSHTGVDEARGATNDRALAELGLFDAVFSGHAHFRPRKMEMEKVNGGASLLHPGVHNGQAVVWASFDMVRTEAGARCTGREGGADLIDETYEADPQMDLWLAGFSQQFEAILSEEVGMCVGLGKYTVDGSNPPPLNYIYHSSLADALLSAFGPPGRTVAAINSAGVRADLREGMLQFRDVEACWPWKGSVHQCQVTGKLIMDLLHQNATQVARCQDDGMFLHFGGLNYEVEGDSPVNVLIGGEPMLEEEWYCFVADSYLVTSYLADYPSAVSGRRDVEDCGVSTQQCILNHIKAMHAQGRTFGAV